MLSGASNAYIQAALEKNGHAVSIKTIIQDKKELDAEAMETFASERAALTARKLAYLDRIARKLETTAQQAEAGIPDGTYWIEVERDGAKTMEERTRWKVRPSLLAKVQALGALNKVILDSAKLAGLVVEKQEHSGVITNRNVDAEASQEDIAAARRAIDEAA